jgi:hypothetical protein
LEAGLATEHRAVNVAIERFEKPRPPLKVDPRSSGNATFDVHMSARAQVSLEKKMKKEEKEGEKSILGGSKCIDYEISLTYSSGLRFAIGS